MSANILYSMAGVTLFCVGLYAVIVYAHLLRKILAINVMSTGTALLLIAATRRTPTMIPDPVPQALVITGIVVLVSATAFALALVCRINDKTGKARLPEENSE